MALVYIRPDADSIDGNWVNESASNVNLYDSLNESASPFDADYIRSENNPTNDIVRLRLGNFGSVPTEPMTVRYRYKKVVSGGETLSFKVRLIQGGSPETTIAEWEHSDVDEAYVTQDQPLTTPQFESIIDFDDLYLEFEAISGALEVAEGALGLLTDETEGFAIDATSYDSVTPAAYVGGPVGGTVATIDAGTPANDLSNVALDSSNLVQSGTSPKMVQWNEAPFVRWTPHNYIQQSQTFNTWSSNNLTVVSNAVAAPDGTTTAESVEPWATNFIHYTQSASISGAIGGAVYTMSCYFKVGSPAQQYVYFLIKTNDGTEWVHATFDISGGSATQSVVGGSGAPVIHDTDIVSAGSGWYRASMTFSMTNDTRYPTIGTSDTGTPTVPSGGEYQYLGSANLFYLWGAQINRGYIATPYLATTSATRIGIPQAYDTYEELFGILVEPAATNVSFGSQTIGGTSWSGVVDVTPTQNTATAPDGSTTATTLTEGGSNSRQMAYQAITLAAGLATFSVFLKRKDRQWACVNLSDNAGTDRYTVIVDLDTGAITQASPEGSPTNTAYTTTAIGNGWYRVSVTMTLANANPFVQVGLSNSATPTVTTGAAVYTGDSASGGYFWGAQLELGSIATSYIPTLSGTVTRAVDVVRCTVASVPYNTTEGSIYVDTAVSGGALTAIWSLVGASGIPELIVNGGTWYQYDGITGLSINLGTVFADTRTQISTALKTGDTDASRDGGAVGSDTEALATDVTYFGFGGDWISVPVQIYRFAYVPRHVETEDGNLETWRFNF